MDEIREELEETFISGGSETTVVEMLGVQDEERPFTHVLRWLLSQNSEHEAGGAFLDSLCNLIDLEGGLDMSTVTVESFDSYLGEENNEVDIVILEEQICVGVEIKTRHPADASELEEEYEALNEAYDRDQYQMVYLTHDPNSQPEPELNNYQRVEWEELTAAFRNQISEATEDWCGFLNHLFDHIEDTVMGVEVTAVEQMDNKIEKGAFYAYTQDFITESKSAYWDVIRQFIKDVAAEIDELDRPDWSIDSESDNPWLARSWYYRLRDEHDLNYGHGNPNELAIYCEDWPSGADGEDEDEHLTVRFNINIRGIDSSGNSTAQTNQTISSPFGVEVNFDIFTDGDEDRQQDVREAFFENLGNDRLNEIRDRGFVDDTSSQSTYHIIGKLIESDWPPDEDNCESVIDELSWLLSTIYEVTEETLEEIRNRSSRAD